jgi:ATP-dependent DNA helicase RecG
MSADSSIQPLPPLKTGVRDLRGVGPERQAQLARLGLFTVGDLLLHAPHRHEDRRHLKSIRELTTDEPSTTRGAVVAMGLKTYKGGSKSVFDLILEDGTARLHCRWWNLPFMQNYFAVGEEVFVFGKLTGLKPRTVVHPETEVIESGEEISIHINRIAPIYPLTEGLPQRWLRALIWRTLEQYATAIEEPYNPALAPSFPSRIDAIRRIHFPESYDQATIARRKLALDEFVQMQKEIRARRANFEAKSKALPCSGTNLLIKPFLASLGFKLTDAQTRVLKEMRHDMGAKHPMRRLLQGDVGSGKTAVAACCSLMAIESGFNAAIMAPTEILATQHYETFQKWFEPLGVEVHLQTGSRKTLDASPAKLAFNNPTASKGRFVIGTHALIESGFELEKLGLVIIDEQHKFGVVQREKLLRKGIYPHLLVMTATPIPRTLGLTIYGELDVSTIDELPKGRGLITTFVRTAAALPAVWKFVREKLESGRQAYVVYPRIEESGPTGLKAVNVEYENIRKQFPSQNVGLLHGRLDAAQKKLVMDQFRQNKIQLLLSTPIIEVGVDVPNATIMVIENADQFGLAQLHQLRGRIGRGSEDSQCILMAAGKKPESRQKLKVMEDTLDGFKIAEADLKLRGPGELLGQSQSGAAPLKFGDLVQDFDLIELARKIAADTI